MDTKIAENYVNYQDRAHEFDPGDVVTPYGGSTDTAGRVLAVYPAIGMVDVEFPTGSQRLPVETLQRFSPEHGVAIPPKTDSVPGGHPTAPGKEQAEVRLANHRRVAEAFVKKALYWGAADRRYRATKAEVATGHFTCPKCKEAALRPAVYKRRGGKSEKLLGCPSCMFLVKKSDILGHPECEADTEPESAEVI